MPLREGGRTLQARLGDWTTIYYHRSDNVSDVQKEALIDYRRYENGGKWYVLLDEAHKGGKEDSKRQAYYAVMAREGFLFNFSATFTDPQDIVTTVKKYNLQEFIQNGHGKNIYLNEKEYTAFKNRRDEISHAERQKIVLKSLITLACVSRRVTELRAETGLDNLYHLPLMLTLVNSVNTDTENEKNDMPFEKVEGFEKSLRPKVNGEDMPLLVPEYREVRGGAATPAKFVMSSETLDRFQTWLCNTSDSVLAVRDNLSSREIQRLREATVDGNVQIANDKHYASLPFLQSRLQSHLSRTVKTADAVRELDEGVDIVHFRQIRAQLDQAEMNDLRAKIKTVSAGGISEDEKKEWARQFADGNISGEEFEKRLRGKSEESFKTLQIRNIPKHYYMPVVVVERGKANFITHVIKEESEWQFLNSLEQWLETHTPEWDAWMFSKIDESVDKIHIPYYDSDKNDQRRFLPDFVFWMCRGDEYQVMFVDPKGTAHTSAYRKIDGYKNLFEQNGVRRRFIYRTSHVSVGLLMFNTDQAVLTEYRRFWSGDPADIFMRP